MLNKKLLYLIGSLFLSTCCLAENGIFSKEASNATSNWLFSDRFINVRGIPIDFNDFFAKPISDLFDTLGVPDYQVGWLDYCDTLGISLSSNIFGKDFAGCEFPVKVYLWETSSNDYLACFCTYGEESIIRSFPVTHKYDECGWFVNWLSFYSGDDFIMFSWQKIKDIDSVLTWSHLDAPCVSPYNSTHNISLKDSYFANFKLLRRSFAISRDYRLSSLVGMTRKKFFRLMGQPLNSILINRCNMPELYKRETMIIMDDLPISFIVDRYNGPIYSLDVFYESDRLFYISIVRDEELQIEY